MDRLNRGSRKGAAWRREGVEQMTGTRRGRSRGLYVQKWQEPEVAAGALWLAAGRASGDSVGGRASRCSLWMGLVTNV